MALSGEAFGEDHPSTYDANDRSAPDYDPARAAAYERDRARKMGGHVGELSGEAFGEDQSGFFVPGQEPSLGSGLGVDVEERNR